MQPGQTQPAVAGGQGGLLGGGGEPADGVHRQHPAGLVQDDAVDDGVARDPGQRAAADQVAVGRASRRPRPRLRRAAPGWSRPRTRGDRAGPPWCRGRRARRRRGPSAPGRRRGADHGSARPPQDRHRCWSRSRRHGPSRRSGPARSATVSPPAWSSWPLSRTIPVWSVAMPRCRRSRAFSSYRSARSGSEHRQQVPGQVLRTGRVEPAGVLGQQAVDLVPPLPHHPHRQPLQRRPADVDVLPRDRTRGQRSTQLAQGPGVGAGQLRVLHVRRRPPR